jgi:hypothetical protein
MLFIAESIPRVPWIWPSVRRGHCECQDLILMYLVCFHLTSGSFIRGKPAQKEQYILIQSRGISENLKKGLFSISKGTLR